MPSTRALACTQLEYLTDADWEGSEEGMMSNLCVWPNPSNQWEM